MTEIDQPSYLTSGMEQRVVLLKGQESLLLFGDVYEGDERFQKKEGRKTIQTALPSLLQEGWSVRRIVPVPVEGESEPVAYAILERPVIF